MRIRSHLIAVFVLAMGLGASAIYVYKNPNQVRDLYFSWSESCTLGEKYCVALLYPLKVLADTAFEIKRKRIPLADLPILRIYMSDGALRKLQDKRLATLKKERPILLNEDTDWVKASLLANDGSTTNKARAHVRLKGDWADHFKNSQKLSFRIKVRGGRKIFGMSKFSVQAPHTRRYQFEPLMLDMMREFGVLAPRYFFVDVRLNDMKIGIMALEEHFTKQLVESQGRREGPILAFDEEWVWRQRDLNYNHGGRHFHRAGDLNFDHRDYPIKVFRAGRFEPGTIKNQHKIRAMGLLRDFMDKVIDAGETFDMNKLSRWWIVINIWKAQHGATLHNLRFYFDPISGLLEPVAFDNSDDSEKPRKKTALIGNVVTRKLEDAPEFRQTTRDNLRQITDIVISDDFGRKYKQQQKRYLDILEIDGRKLNEISLSELKLNLAGFIQSLEQEHFSPPVDPPLKMRHRRPRAPEGLSNPGMLKRDGPIYAHLRTRLFWYPDRLELEFKNMTLKPLTIEAVYYESEPDKNLLDNVDTVPVFQAGGTDHVVTKSLALSEFNPRDPLLVRYTYKSKQYTRPVPLQFRDYDPGFPGQEVTHRWFEQQGAVVNRRRQTVIFPSGIHRLDRNIETRPDWLMVFLPGTELELQKGALLKINGPLYSLGREDSPVKIRIESSADKGLLGSWGGVSVQNAKRGSFMLHTVVTGHGHSRPAQRQDSMGLTGCVTFYRSEVSIKDSIFANLQCEDSLNIVSSEFRLDGVTIDKAQADAFDSDFATGTIVDSTFKFSRNDGVDTSGSKVRLENTRFLTIGDKAISVGERSELSADKIEIKKAKYGIVSKDRSVARITNALISDIDNTGLFAYIKKSEYGPSQLYCTNCRFESVDSRAIAQYGSRITIDGQAVASKYLSRKHLQAASP